METFDTPVAVFLLVLSTFASLVSVIPKPTVAASSKGGATTQSPFSADGFAQDLPTPSNDEPIGPHNDKERSNSAGILDRLNNKGLSRYKSSTTVSTTVVDNKTSDSASLPVAISNVTEVPVSTVQSNDNDNNTLATMNPNITMTTEIENTSFAENTNAPSNISIEPLSTKTSMVVSSLIPPTEISSSPPSLLSSSPTIQTPKMPATTSSSIPLFSSSPVINDTLHPKHRRARHASIVFFLLPFLIAGGVALIIFIGSYLRKKIRLDKLRHQLMPLYSFDPQEGEDWETELLTEPRASTQPTLPTVMTTKATSSAAGNDPLKLRFAPETIEV